MRLLAIRCRLRVCGWTIGGFVRVCREGDWISVGQSGKRRGRGAEYWWGSPGGTTSQVTLFSTSCVILCLYVFLLSFWECQTFIGKNEDGFVLSSIQKGQWRVDQFLSSNQEAALCWGLSVRCCFCPAEIQIHVKPACQFIAKKFNLGISQRW